MIRGGPVVGWAALLIGCAASPAHTSPPDEVRATLAGDADGEVADPAAQPDAAVQHADARSDDDAALLVNAALADEPIYIPGARKRPADVVAQSNDDREMARWNAGGGAATVAVGSERQKAPHPAPRVKVDLISVRGRVDEGEVLKQVRAKSYWPFRLCYEAGLRRAQKLRGTVRVRIALDTRARARKPKKLAAELSDDQVVACVLDAAGALALSLPPVRKTPELTLEVSLYPGDEPVSARETAGALPSADLEAVSRSLRETWPQLAGCYASGLTRDPALWGRIAVRLVIATRGRVREASEVESRFPDPAVTGCVCRTLGLLDGLAAPDGTRLVYPLRFGAPPAAPSDGGT